MTWLDRWSYRLIWIALGMLLVALFQAIRVPEPERAAWLEACMWFTLSIALGTYRHFRRPRS